MGSGWFVALSSSSLRPRLRLYLSFQAFNMFQAATLSPLFFFSPAVLSRAALYTCGVVGSLSYIGATATYVQVLYPSDK